MKKLLLILICLFVSFEVKSYESTEHKWSFFGKHKSSSFYIDFKNIETRGGFVYWYYLNSSNDPELSVISYFKGDCRDMRWIKLEQFLYEKPMGKKFITRVSPEKGWEFPIPGSNNERHLRMVCKNSSK